MDAISCYVEGMDVCPAEEKDEISKFHHNIAAAYDKMVGSLFFFMGPVVSERVAVHRH